MEKPYKGRAKINETINEFIIEVPSKKNWFIIIFTTAWLYMWLVGEVVAIGILTGMFGDNDGGFATPFLLFWLTGWTVGGFFEIRILIWMIAGKEIISFSNTELRIHKRAMLLSKPKIYDIKKVKNLAVNPNTGNFLTNLYGINFWNPGSQGNFKFNYDHKTVKMANGIDEAEAKYLLEKIQTKNLLSE